MTGRPGANASSSEARAPRRSARSAKALVVNCSYELTRSNRRRVFYNLGVEKLSNYLEAQGYQVTRAIGDPGLFVTDYDLVCVSAIFSWHAPIAADIAVRARNAGVEVWAGGPGMYGVRSWFEAQTGVKPVWQPDPRFDRQPGDYRYIYAVRGCEGESVDDGPPVPCRWCNVPKVEGTVYLYNPDFQPAPMLLDNNLSGSPVWMQDATIAKYRDAGVPIVDANSGFEPGRFDLETRGRWEPVLRGPWRCGFDRIEEEAHVRNFFRLLSDIPARRKRIYAMCGNEPIATCYERAEKVIEMGGEPHVQFEIPLGALDRYDPMLWPANDQPKHDWTMQLGWDFARYYTGMFWKSCHITEFEPRPKERPGERPFRDLLRRVA
jgi:hypothetical protein